MCERKYHSLTEGDIDTLCRNGCSAEDWSRVLVSEGTDVARVVQVQFAGDVWVGGHDGTLMGEDGVPRRAGLCRARLRDVRIGDDCVIADVGGWLSGLDIEDRVLVENVGTIACTGETTFGNGVEVEVLNEGGGRELRITRETSAQTAYLSVLYRDRPELVAALEKMADRLCDEVRGTRAALGRGAHIVNCNEMLNVQVGPAARINGALSLREGTVDSSAEAPTVVGQGVTAEAFIFQKGASVKDGAMVAKSLVGEGTKIGKQFSSENSVFFANCEGFHSEACSVFAGPYTVTHHRSTLLIAALFSFYNAGSGTNQSNHMYKLGPLHQGILERGCKTGSFSYLLWPSRVGAFTAIMGKHYANFDTTDFPFSYIDEHDGKSMLVPGMNFFTVGTMRDGEKWPARDRRTSDSKLDLLIFDVLSPYTGQKMIRGSRLLMELYDASKKGQEFVTYNGIHIKRLLLKTCRRYYALALDKYLGDVVVGRLEANAAAPLRDVLKPDARGTAGNAEWVDVCGLLCDKTRLDAVTAAVTAGEIESFASLQAGLRSIHESYKADEWNWVLSAYKALNGTDLVDETDDALREFFDRWQKSSLKLLNMVKGDAQKEFEGSTRLGFGIDGNGDADFDAVRGTFEGNKFVRKLVADAEVTEQRCEAVVGRIK